MSTIKGINWPKAKRENAVLIKKIIYQYAPISRAEIASMLSLTRATITNNVTKLIEDGLVCEVDDEVLSENVLGRKPVMLAYETKGFYYIGLEISPKGLFFVLCDIHGKIIESQMMNYEIQEYAQTLEYLFHTIQSFRNNSKISIEKIRGVGIGIPGSVNRNKGEIKHSPWDIWKDNNIELDLKERLGIPVIIENNVTARAIGESLFNKESPSTFAYLFVSKGIACPLVIQSSTFKRKVIGAGELGHMSIDANGQQCPRCGDYGCLELYASEEAIINKANKIMKNNKNSILHEIVQDKLYIEDIVVAAKKGDQQMIQVLDEAAKYIAIGICNVIKFMSPKVVIVDAYIMTLDVIKENFLKYVDLHLGQNRWSTSEFIFKEYNKFGGAVGSAGNVMKTMLLES